MTSPLTLLIDLDDTLLVNPVKEFMEKYLKLLSAYMEPYVDPKRMVPQLLKSTDLMIEKSHPYQTLESVFDADFYPALGLDIEEIKPIVDRFYSDVFPEIQSLTSPRPEAIEAIQHAFNQGYHVVIATNPLFPKLANAHRLAWAGLPESEYSYDLVTSYESMHYAKPNSAYYTEILGQVGWPEHPVCMVGNSYEFDILPVNRLGIPAFFLEDSATADCTPLDGVKHGSLSGLIPWMDSISARQLESTYDQVDSVLAILHSTPGALASLTKNLSQEQWQKKPIENLGSIADAIHSLLDVEKTNSLLYKQNLTYEPNLRLEQRITQLCQQEIESGSTHPCSDLTEFFTRRSIFLSRLKGNDQNLLQNMVEHPDFGSLTLLEYLSFLSINDRHYLRLVKNLINRLLD